MNQSPPLKSSPPFYIYLSQLQSIGASEGEERNERDRGLVKRVGKDDVLVVMEYVCASASVSLVLLLLIRAENAGSRERLYKGDRRFLILSLLFALDSLVERIKLLMFSSSLSTRVRVQYSPWKMCSSFPSKATGFTTRRLD